MGCNQFKLYLSKIFTGYLKESGRRWERLVGTDHRGNKKCIHGSVKSIEQLRQDNDRSGPVKVLGLLLHMDRKSHIETLLPQSSSG